MCFPDGMTAGIHERNGALWHEAKRRIDLAQRRRRNGGSKKTWATDYETAIFWAGEKFEFQHGRPGSSVIKSAKVPPEKLTNPNEKPVDLLRFIISETCPRGGTVLDCFMGSGSTGEAAKKSGRDFIGIELDEKYYKMAKQRILESHEQIDLMTMLEDT